VGLECRSQLYRVDLRGQIAGIQGRTTWIGKDNEIPESRLLGREKGPQSIFLPSYVYPENHQEDPNDEQQIGLIYSINERVYELSGKDGK
jgi:hypothetical protein